MKRVIQTVLAATLLASRIVFSVLFLSSPSFSGNSPVFEHATSGAIPRLSPGVLRALELQLHGACLVRGNPLQIAGVLLPSELQAQGRRGNTEGIAVEFKLEKALADPNEFSALQKSLAGTPEALQLSIAEGLATIMARNGRDTDSIAAALILKRALTVPDAFQAVQRSLAASPDALNRSISAQLADLRRSIPDNEQTRDFFHTTFDPLEKMMARYKLSELGREIASYFEASKATGGLSDEASGVFVGDSSSDEPRHGRDHLAPTPSSPPGQQAKEIPPPARDVTHVAVQPAGFKSWLFWLMKKLDSKPALETMVENDIRALPPKIQSRLRTNERDWEKRGKASGPLFVSGDLDRRKPSIFEGGAETITGFNAGALIGKNVEIIPVSYDRKTIREGTPYSGIVLSVYERNGFVEYKLLQSDGQVVMVPFYGKYGPHSYSTVFHGHTVREIHENAYQPEKKYVGLTVFARVYGAIPQKSKKSVRYVGPVLVGTVIDQDQSHLTLLRKDGTRYILSIPKDGFLQVDLVPARSIPMEGTANWRQRFGSVDQLIGQEVVMQGAWPSGGYTARILNIEPVALGNSKIRVKVQNGLEMINDSNWILKPSKNPANIFKDDVAPPSFLGQIVDVQLIHVSLWSVGYAQKSGIDEHAIIDTRGVVIDQGTNYMVIHAANGETIRLDLSRLKEVTPNYFFPHQAKPYIRVQPLGMWGRL